MSANILQFPDQRKPEPSQLDRLEAFRIAHGLTTSEAMVIGISSDQDGLYDRLEAIKEYAATLGSFKAAVMDIFEVIRDVPAEVENAWNNTVAAMAEELESEFSDFLSRGYVPRDLPPNVTELAPPPIYPDRDFGTAS